MNALLLFLTLATQQPLDALKAEIKALEPEKLVWREIPWRYCLFDGIEASRKEKKPILLWAFLYEGSGAGVRISL